MSRRFTVQCDLRLSVEVTAYDRKDARACAAEWFNYLSWVGLKHLLQEDFDSEVPEYVMAFLLEELPQGQEFARAATVRRGGLYIPPGVQENTLSYDSEPPSRSGLPPMDFNEKRTAQPGVQGVANAPASVEVALARTGVPREGQPADRSTGPGT